MSGHQFTAEQLAQMKVNDYANGRIKEQQESGLSIHYDPKNDRTTDNRHLDETRYTPTQEDRAPLLYPKEKK